MSLRMAKSLMACLVAEKYKALAIQITLGSVVMSCLSISESVERNSYCVASANCFSSLTTNSRLSARVT